MTLEFQWVAMDTWQAKAGGYRYQIRFTGTTQHGPWFLDVYKDATSRPSHVDMSRMHRLPDRATAEFWANYHASDAARAESGALEAHGLSR